MSAPLDPCITHKGFYIETYTARDAVLHMPRLAKRFRNACYSDNPPRCICCRRPFVVCRPFVVYPPPVWVVVRPMVGDIRSAPIIGYYGVCADCADDERAIVSAVGKAVGLSHVEFSEGAA